MLNRKFAVMRTRGFAQRSELLCCGTVSWNCVSSLRVEWVVHNEALFVLRGTMVIMLILPLAGVSEATRPHSHFGPVRQIRASFAAPYTRFATI